MWLLLYPLFTRWKCIRSVSEVHHRAARAMSACSACFCFFHVLQGCMPVFGKKCGVLSGLCLTTALMSLLRFAKPLGGHQQGGLAWSRNVVKYDSQGCVSPATGVV